MTHEPSSDSAETQVDTNHSYVFKGMRRSATILGIPLWPVAITFGSVWMITIFLRSMIWWLLLPAILPTLWMITKHDDKTFGILWLGLKTRWRNRNKAFWKGSSYTPLTYPRNRPWRRR